MSAEIIAQLQARIRESERDLNIVFGSALKVVREKEEAEELAARLSAELTAARARIAELEAAAVEPTKGKKRGG